METVYDWITVAFFAGLIVLLLQRSVGDGPPRDSMLHYAFPAIGCAVTNYLGNHDQHVLAILLFVAVVGYTFYFLKPLQLR